MPAGIPDAAMDGRGLVLSHRGVLRPASGCLAMGRGAEHPASLSLAAPGRPEIPTLPHARDGRRRARRGSGRGGTLTPLSFIGASVFLGGTPALPGFGTSLTGARTF